MKKIIKFSSVGLAVALVAVLLFLFIPARVDVAQEGFLPGTVKKSGFLSISSDVAFAVNSPPPEIEATYAPATTGHGVTFRSVGVSPGVFATYCAVVKPTGLAVDDLMIAHILSEGSTQAITAPANWTGIRQDNTNSTGVALFWKIAVQADVDASTFTFTVGQSRNKGVITAWTGHDPTTPINANSGQVSEYTSNLVAPSITPSVADCEICLFCGSQVVRTFSDYAIATDNPGSWNERYDMAYPVHNSMALASALRPEATATGNGTATCSGDTYPVGQLVAIAPVPVSTPTVTTQAVSSIATTTATGNGNITDDGGATATRGMCWSTSANPTTADNHNTNGTGEGAYTVPMTSLTPGQHYYVKAYATNTEGTSYGGQVEFTALNPEISNSPDNNAFGILAVNTYSDTAINYFTITNTGVGAIDVTVCATDLTGGDDTWTLSDTATPGENTYGLKAGLDDGDDTFDVIVKRNATYNTLVSNLAESTTQDWGLRLYMPTSVTDYDGQQMSATLTLVCSAH